MSGFPLFVPLTDEAKEALDGRDYVEIDHLPFRVGRESRMGVTDGVEFYLERHKHGDAPGNDLYLLDRGSLLHVSRRHLEIDTSADGQIHIHDLGSRCGTHVDGESIGGKDEPGSLTLGSESEIVVGTIDSPYRFAVRHLERFAGLYRRSAAPDA